MSIIAWPLSCEEPWVSDTPAADSPVLAYCCWRLWWTVIICCGGCCFCAMWGYKYMLLQVDLQLATNRFIMLQFSQLYALLMHATQSHSWLNYHLLCSFNLNPLLLHLYLTFLSDCLLKLVAQVSDFFCLNAIPLAHSVHRIRSPRPFLLHFGDPFSCLSWQSLMNFCNSLSYTFCTFLNSSFSLSDLSLISTILSYLFLVRSIVLLCLFLSISIYLIRLIKFCASSCDRCHTSCTSKREYLCFLMLF